MKTLNGPEALKSRLFDISCSNLDVSSSLPFPVGPEFLAGYAYGMSRAHKEALSHIDELGSLRCSVTKSEEMISTHSNKISSLERNLAFASGHYFQSMHMMRDRLSKLEDRNLESSKNLQLALFRVMQLEKKSSMCRYHFRKILGLFKKLKYSKRGLALVLALAAFLVLIQKESFLNLPPQPLPPMYVQDPLFADSKLPPRSATIILSNLPRHVQQRRHNLAFFLYPCQRRYPPPQLPPGRSLVEDITEMASKRQIYALYAVVDVWPFFRPQQALPHSACEEGSCNMRLQ
eukprot:764580-Hanusia_phi.AAC.3